MRRRRARCAGRPPWRRRSPPPARASPPTAPASLPWCARAAPARARTRTPGPAPIPARAAPSCRWPRQAAPQDAAAASCQPRPRPRRGRHRRFRFGSARPPSSAVPARRRAPGAPLAIRSHPHCPWTLSRLECAASGATGLRSGLERLGASAEVPGGVVDAPRAGGDGGGDDVVAGGEHQRRSRELPAA